MKIKNKKYKDEEGEKDEKSNENEEDDEKAEEAGETVANGIELELASGALQRCSQQIGFKGTCIVDQSDYCKQAPYDLVLNYYNINLFIDMTDPATLKESIEWQYISFPIKTIQHHPLCIIIKAKQNSLTEFNKAIQVYKFCKKGIDPITLGKMQKAAIDDCLIQFSNNLEGPDQAVVDAQAKGEEIDPDTLPSIAGNNNQEESHQEKHKTQGTCKKGCPNKKV